MHFNRLPRLAAGLVLGASLALTSAAAFTDTQDHWAASSIQKWSQEYGIIQGYDDGTFRPDASITRGAFAGIMDRFLHFQASSPAETFSDTAGTYWEASILKLHAAGVYLGNGGKALSGQSITRQQAVTMIARAFQIDAAALDLPYGDAAQISEYARPAVAEMAARGWLTDCQDGNFRPTDPITRAEIVNLLSNMIDRLVQTPEGLSGEASGTVMINSAEGASLSDMTVAGDLIVAPGVTGPVTLQNVDVQGAIRNFSSVEIAEAEGGGTEPGPLVVVDPSQPQDPAQPQDPVQSQDPIQPEAPGIQPGEVYVPGATTGSTIEYSGKRIPVYADREASRLYEGDFHWEEDRLVYDGGAFRTRFGIDVSAHQNRSCENNSIDWDAAARDGVEFAMVRAGFRGTSNGTLNADQFYRENITGAMDAGIETGVYFFAQAVTVEEALEEADFVIELLQGLEINGPVAYDWEMHDASYRVYGTTPEMATACAVAFCQRVQEAGYTPMVYAGTYVSYMKYDQGALAPYLSWYPEYKGASSEKLCPTLYYQMDYWQFSSNCFIDGIGGRVDANLQFLPW